MHKFASALMQAQNVALSGHMRPDGDCIGSCMGLYYYLKDNYPHLSIDIYLEPFDDIYLSLKDADQIMHQADGNKKYDLFIALDTSTKERLSFAEVLFDRADHTICIDHHISNPAYADENWIVSDASSTGEVLVDLMDEDKISVDTAKALYIALISDTGVFKQSNTTPHTLRQASILLKKNIPFSDMIDYYFYGKTYLQNRILGYALDHSQLLADGKMIISILSRDVLDLYQAKHHDLEGIAAQLRTTAGIEIAVFASEQMDGQYKFSLRSKNQLDVNKIANMFGGGGHVKASGFTTAKDPHYIVEQMIQMMEEQLGHV